MKTAIIHLSDLHFKNNWEEHQSVVIDALFSDLEDQISALGGRRVFLALTGDLVYSAEDSTQYQLLLDSLSVRLEKIGITKEKRILVPGNHDVSRESVRKVNLEHRAIVERGFSESEFNDYLDRKDNLLKEKFKNYIEFQRKFTAYGISGDDCIGAGWDLGEGIGIYCLNSALCSSGGLDEYSDKLGDCGRLAVGTRKLQKWISNSKLDCRILLMHHPLGWLCSWAREDLRRTLNKEFSLCLSGHNHEQDVLHKMVEGSDLVDVSAPALLTTKYDELGYSIIQMDRSGVETICYRQWTKHRSFRSGVSFSNTDDGIVRVGGISALGRRPTEHDSISATLDKSWRDSLESYTGQPSVWVIPRISTRSEAKSDRDRKSDAYIDLNDLIKAPWNAFIKAPPQFGLTVLGRYLRKAAWDDGKKPWIYVDAKVTKYHSVEKEIKDQLQFFGVDIGGVGAVIVDSWIMSEKDHHKLLKRVSEFSAGIPMLVMNTVDPFSIASDGDLPPLDRDYRQLYLCSLSKNKIRQLSGSYNEQRQIAPEDLLVERIVSDIDALNLHRTPLNCLTLLQAAEFNFDESPVNRTAMIDRVLSILFNVDFIPIYKSRPDLKDCEYVLGYFCEQLIRESKYIFSREQFISSTNLFCRKRVLELDTSLVFDILSASGIIVLSGDEFCFRFAYWVYYFAAQRMHQDQEFADYILSDMKYASFPEVIEFYTGIDRRREDALRVLISDISSLCDEVNRKCGLPEVLNPYKELQWEASDEVIKKMKDEIGEDVKNSNLPDVVKDQYADALYRPEQPYSQQIRGVLKEYSMLSLMRAVVAASRALRNSDYASPATKREMLDLIMRCFEQISSVLLVLAPMLAKRRSASFDGAGFVLTDNFSDSEEKRLWEVLLAVPHNVVTWYVDDLYSKKMGPLLGDYLDRDMGDLSRHEMHLLIIRKRPKGWKKRIDSYIESVGWNSFYLHDLNDALRTQYRYAFVTKDVLSDIGYLLKKIVAKHEKGKKKPGEKLIKSVLDTVLPKREVDEG